MKMGPSICFGVITTLLLTASFKTAFAQSEAVVLPSHPAAWINSPPLSTQMLEGKIAALWFFEEQCPRCRERWPGLIKASQELQDLPVVFIAVNSGNDRASVERYLRENKVTWPTIVDADRSFESAYLGSEISLQNIFQFRILGTDGRLSYANSGSVEEAVRSAAQTATWRVSPEKMTPKLKQAWIAVEFANFPAAATAIRQGLKSTDDKTNTAAAELNDYVLGQAKTLVDEFHFSGETGEWAKYQLAMRLKQEFDGYETSSLFEGDARKLASHPDVKKQLSAQRQLGEIKRALAANGNQLTPILSNRLKKLIANFADTDAADEAQQLLNGPETSPIRTGM